MCSCVFTFSDHLQSLSLKVHNFSGDRTNNICSFGGILVETPILPQINYTINTKHGPYCDVNQCPLFVQTFTLPSHNTRLFLYAFFEYFSINITIDVHAEKCAAILNPCAICSLKIKNDQLKWVTNTMASYANIDTDDFTLYCGNMFYTLVTITVKVDKCLKIQSFPRSDERGCRIRIPGEYGEYTGDLNIQIRLFLPKHPVTFQKCIQMSQASRSLSVLESSKNIYVSFTNESEIELNTISIRVEHVYVCSYYHYQYHIIVKQPSVLKLYCPVYRPQSAPFSRDESSLCSLIICNPRVTRVSLQVGLHRRLILKWTSYHKLYTSHTVVPDYHTVEFANFIVRKKCLSDQHGYVTGLIHMFVEDSLEDRMAHYIIKYYKVEELFITRFDGLVTFVADLEYMECDMYLFYEWGKSIYNKAGAIHSLTSTRFRVGTMY